MDRLMDVIRSEEPVSPEDGVAAMRVLAPIVEAAPDDDEACEAAAGVIARLEPGSPLQALFDWWFVVTTGAKSPSGAAYHLPDELGLAVLAPMNRLLNFPAGVPAATRADAFRRLGAMLTELDAKLVLDNYGKSKLPGERPVWATLLDDVRDTVDGLRASQRVEPLEVPEQTVKHAMKVEGIADGSRRWKEMLRRSTQLVEWLNEVVAIQALAEPWSTSWDVELADAVPLVARDALGDLAELVLAPVLVDGDAYVDDVATIAKALEVAAEGLDASARTWLAQIADSWVEQAGVEVPVLTDTIRRQRAVHATIERLTERGDDATEIELALLEHDLDEAERLIASADEQRVHADRLRVQRGRFERLTAVGEADHAAELQAIRTALAANEADRARQLINALEQEIEASRRHETLAATRERLDGLRTFEPPSSVLFDLEEALGAAEQHGSPKQLAELLERVDIQASEWERRRLTDARQLLDDARQALERDHDRIAPDRLEQLAGDLGELQVELDDGELMVAWREGARLRQAIEQARGNRWTPTDGEEALVRHIVGYCQARMDLDAADLRRLYVSLKTKPFVILAGLTGSGKSSAARLIAEAIGSSASNGQFRRVAVRPDWIDQTEVLGFVSPMTNRFEPGWLAEATRSCLEHPDQIHVVLLDEMNLAPVEQYLAEWLSAMEEARGGSPDVRLPLYPRSAEPSNAAEWPAELPFPPNLFMIGTVNVDETTRPLSERVLDRANVLQLNVSVTERHHQSASAANEIGPIQVRYSDWMTLVRQEPDDRHHDFLRDVAEILRTVEIGIGLRSHLELERFIANATGVIDDTEALDFGLLQRIVPKIRGFKGELAEGIQSLREELDDVGAVRCVAAVDRWLDPRVADDEYLDGTDARVALVLT